MEKRNVAEPKRTPSKELASGDWAKEAAAQFKPVAKKPVKK